MTQSLASGTPEHITAVSIADGLNAPFVGEHNLSHVQHFVDEVVLVDDDAIIRAMLLIMERAKLALEPSGAAPFAALLSGAISLPEGCRTACVVSGGNVDRGTLSRVLTES